MTVSAIQKTPLTEKLYEVSTELGMNIMTSDDQEYHNFGAFFFERYNSIQDKNLYYAYDTRDEEIQIFDDSVDALRWCKLK
ncbi:hypothetical protein M2454_002790 [Aequitasia blattaphilus]|uniref:Uncharacterized protein n=1 Tax=Aequitasia blattaphilus TaxID=2949332 RepID=A0ABT1EC94_9FIRM|nr:hypothetical protein [Aequitasia blattaphilus]MCP1103450.1 hypothetical protein [Aequitasia blattaphilus]MCR8616090.1 hypothetical protein [Aequitasia blattaphilus]